MTPTDKKPAEPVKGSPVTAATPPNDQVNQTNAAAANTPSNQSTKPVGGVSEVKNDTPAKATNDEAIVDANGVKHDPNAPPEDPAAPLTKNEERELETILDGGEDDDDAPATTGDRSAEGESINKFLRLLTATKDSPDSHPCWGAAGISITLGDLRNIARAGGGRW